MTDGIIGSVASGSSPTHTLASGSNRMVIALVIARGSGSVLIQSCTYNGASMTALGSQVRKTDSDQGVAVLGFQLLEADLPANGSYSVAPTALDDTYITAIVFAVGNLAQQTKEATASTTGSGNSASTSVTTITNSALIVDVVGTQSTTDVTAGSGQTKLAEVDNGSSTGVTASGSTETGGAAGSHTQTLSFNSTEFYAYAIYAFETTGANQSGWFFVL